MKTFLKTLSLVLLITHICFAQWFWQNPLPQGNHIRTIISPDEDNIVAGGLKGFFLKSTDSGLNWDLSYLSQNFSYSELKYFSSENMLYAFVGDVVVGGTILHRSTNIGTNWDSIFTFNYWSMSDMDKNSNNILFAVGSEGKIYKSTDYGYAWDNIPSATNEYLSEIIFFDTQKGCIVGDNGIILRTSDNGNTWLVIPSGTSENLNAIDFCDSMNGIIVGHYNYLLSENSILKTTDGGLNWTKMVISNPQGELLDVKFIDLQNIIIVGGNDDYFGGRDPIVLRSSDGGETWMNISSQFPRGLNSISYYNSNTAVCAGFAGGMYKTTDSGYNWTKLYSGFLSDFGQLCTFDTSGFYTIGTDFPANQLILLYTDNGGEVWQTKNAPSVLYSGYIDFLDADYGMISGNNLIFYTLDGCNTWHQGTTPPNSSFGDVKIINNNKAFLSGSRDSLLKSTDGGNTWFSVNIGTTGYLARIIFKDLLNGLIIANSGPSIITTDGGENWNAINYNFGWLWDGTFFGSDNIALAGSDGRIYISEDAGQSWTEKIVAPSGTYISSISFKDSLNGTAVGETGLILSTTDGGDTWNQQFSPTLTDFSDIEYSQNNSGIIKGEDGVIIGTKKGTQIVGIESEQQNSLPDNFYLSQNFPNPFNPGTTLRYSIPNHSMVIIKVYDILGNEIETLINEEKPAGTYEITWYPANLSSGVYFYQLRAGSYIETKKMILLK